MLPSIHPTGVAGKCVPSKGARAGSNGHPRAAPVIDVIDVTALPNKAAAFINLVNKRRIRIGAANATSPLQTTDSGSSTVRGREPEVMDTSVATIAAAPTASLFENGRPQGPRVPTVTYTAVPISSSLENRKDKPIIDAINGGDVVGGVIGSDVDSHVVGYPRSAAVPSSATGLPRRKEVG
jgi:hypothetical protein